VAANRKHRSDIDLTFRTILRLAALVVVSVVLIRVVVVDSVQEIELMVDVIDRWSLAVVAIGRISQIEIEWLRIDSRVLAVVVVAIMDENEWAVVIDKAIIQEMWE
jgi:hypothetical protein